MTIGLGILQDEYALTGEFQIFHGWAERLKAAGIPVRLFSPKGERLRTQAFQRHETGESLLRTFREQWRFIDQAAAVAASVDLLHVFLPTPNFLWISDRIKKAAGKPVVVTCLGEKAELSKGMSARSLWGGLRFHLLRLIAARLLSEGRYRCDRYVAGTGALAAQLRRSGCAPSIITVQPPLLAPETPPDEASLAAVRGIDPRRTFLYLGHFLPSKGVECLLTAFAVLKDADSRLVLAWSGLGALSEVKRLILKLGIAGRVSIIDFPVHRSTLLSAGCALVLPYPASYGQTSPPMALLEAFRAGVPVIVSGFPYLDDFGSDRETMHRVRPGDWRGLAAMMRHVLDHPDEAQRMRRAQRERLRAMDEAFDPRGFYGL